MKLVILVVCLLSAVYARPQLKGSLAEITEYAFDNNGLGNYFYYFKTSDGSSKEELGSIDNEGTENEALKVYGSYSYIDDQGKQHKVKYTADRDGFKVVGDNYATSPRPIGIGPPPTTIATDTGIRSDVLATLAGK